MFTISKEFHFSASHQLDHLPDGHQCARLHGHNYIIRVVLEGGLNDDGFVRDYADLDPIREFIDNNLDHRHLNDVLGKSLYTTAENLAWYLYSRFTNMIPEIREVQVSETPKTWATYRP